MGDRGNVVIKTGDGEVWLYAHWTGRDLPFPVRKALARATDRWRDAPYLARIIFDAMTDGAHGSLTGYGIHPRLTDNEHAILCVRPESGEVTLHAQGEGGLGEQLQAWSMAAFAELPDEELFRIGNRGRRG